MEGFLICVYLTGLEVKKGFLCEGFFSPRSLIAARQECTFLHMYLFGFLTLPPLPSPLLDASSKFSRDKTWIGSVSHDNSIRFWHAGYLFENDDDNDEEEKEKGNEDVAHKGKNRKGSGGEECLCTPEWQTF